MTITSDPLDRFAQFIARRRRMQEELPLVHSTRCEIFADLARTGALIPQECPVFKNDRLIYLFYGRPAYRSRRGKKPATDIRFLPICLVFKPFQLSQGLKRVFPFDSGAAADGRFRRYVPQRRYLDFQIGRTIESARRAVAYFFDTNRSYFIGTASQLPSIPMDEPEAARYHRMISAEGDAEYDDRRSAIEVQIEGEVPLKDALLAVVLPRAFLQKAEVRRIIVRDWRTYPLTYPTVRGTMPSEYYPVIRDKLLTFLQNGDYL